MKNNVLRAQKVGVWILRVRLSYQAGHVCCGAGKIFASLQRFWAVAARRNSSFAPHGPRNRSRPRPRMRLRCANSISTFFLSFIEMSYCSVLAMSRAIWRASSCSSRVILRAGLSLVVHPKRPTRDACCSYFGVLFGTLIEHSALLMCRLRFANFGSEITNFSTQT